MISNKFKKIVASALCAVVLVFGALASTTNAQVRVGPRRGVFFVHRGPIFYPHLYPYPYGYYVTDPIAYQKELGYSDGLSKGKSDAHHNKPDDPASHKHYTGSSSLAYRDAFLQGYADGYNQRRS